MKIEVKGSLVKVVDGVITIETYEDWRKHVVVNKKRFIYGEWYYLTSKDGCDFLFRSNGCEYIDSVGCLTKINYTKGFSVDHCELFKIGDICTANLEQIEKGIKEEQDEAKYIYKDPDYMKLHNICFKIASKKDFADVVSCRPDLIDKSFTFNTDYSIVYFYSGSIVNGLKTHYYRKMVGKSEFLDTLKSYRN